MTTDIYQLYTSYKDKNIDNDYINKVFEIIIKKDPSILTHINNFTIINDEYAYLGSYSNNEKIITINKDKINHNPEIEQKNILALQIIKHEMEHAKNLKKLEEGRQDIESKIIYYSLRSYLQLKEIDIIKMSSMDRLLLNFNIKVNYETNPGERIADIKSWKYIVNLLKNQRTSEDLLLARKMLYYAYLRGYKDNRYYMDSPTFLFLFNTNQLTELKDLKKTIDKKNYSYDTRLLYGLPLTYDEYNKDILTKVKLQKKLKKMRH